MLHLAVRWADQGRVVALVDMDLHAPGVSFHPWLAPVDEGNDYHKVGVSDLLACYYATRNLEDRSYQFFSPSHCLREFLPEQGKRKWANDGRLFVLPAGNVTVPQYGTVSGTERRGIPASQADPKETPEQQAMRAFAGSFRRDFEGFRVEDHPRKAGIDYLLIDCRTGHPELADLAMGYMADRLVLVSGLNQQNLEGLRITLDKLRPRRIPRGCYADLVVLFSPVPANLSEDSLGRRAIAEGVEALKSRRVPREGEADEALPKVFSLPYTPHLAVSDEPIPRQTLFHAVHPYWEAVVRVAEALEGPVTFDFQESSRQTLRQAREVLGKDEVRPLSRTTATLMQLPKWHWPFAGDSGRIGEWLREFGLDEGWSPQQEELLDGLCGSLSLPIEEKRKTLRKWRDLSGFQWESLVATFQEEKTRFSGLVMDRGGELVSQFFRQQGDWAEFLLGKAAGREAFLLRSPQDPRLFASWKTTPHYWRHLAEALEKANFPQSRVDEARRMAEEALLENPWESLGWQSEVPDWVSSDLLERLLERVASQPLPDDADLCAVLCQAVLQRGQRQEIAKLSPVIDHLLKLAPDRITPHYVRGWFLSEIGGYGESEAAYRRAIELDPKFAPPWNNLGNLLQTHLGRYAESEAAYRRAIELDPKFAPPWNGLGSLLQDHLGRYEESEAAYRRAIELDPKLAYPWNGLGNLLKNHLERYEESEAAYRRAIELNPKDADPWNNLGNLLQDHLGRYEESEAAYRRAIELNPKDAYPWTGLGLLFGDRWRRCREALRCFDQGLALDPDFPYLHLNRGRLRLSLGQGWREDLTQALSGFEKEKDALAIQGRNWLAVALGLNERLPGEDELADALARRPDRAGPRNVVVMRELAFGREIQTRLEEVAARLRSHEEHLDCIQDWHFLAGARPDLREGARQAAAFLMDLPEAQRTRFKDVPQPALLERYRDFVEGRTDGAGDPRDRHCFCDPEEKPVGPEPATGPG
ncbi:MAG: tetratricopeptide repeat protein [Magnetococcales bacterium]|nr:tetratricopeptide repeat protein [Magnetococcales bacterium]